MNIKKILGFAVFLIAILVLVPLFIRATGRWDFFYTLTSVALLSVGAAGVWLTFYIGRINIGQGAYALVGGYVSAILVTQANVSFWLTLPLAGLFCAFISVVIGLPILRLRGVEFDWRNDVNAPTKHEQTHDIGVIAQEVEKVFPEAVTSPKNDGYKSVAYSKLVAPLIEGVKYLYLKFLSHDEQLSTQARQIASLTSEKADNRQVQQLLNENQLKDQEIEKLKNKNLELEKRLQRLEQLMGVSQ